MTAYKLPDGNVLISFSGGRTSGYMLHQILQANGSLPNSCRVTFANTGREATGTLDFVQECAQRWGIHITWLEYTRANNRSTFKTVSHNSAGRNGEPFEELINSRRGYLPNQQTRYCTSEMKVLTIKRYLVNEGWTKWSNTVGIRADEAHRLRTSTDKRWNNWYPLNDAQATKHTVKSFWDAQPFDLKITPGHGNCDGCFLKSEATIAALFIDMPDRMQWWADQEQKVGATFHKRGSYGALAEFVNKQQSWLFNDEAFLCQADGGECTG